MGIWHVKFDEAFLLKETFDRFFQKVRFALVIDGRHIRTYLDHEGASGMSSCRSICCCFLCKKATFPLPRKSSGFWSQEIRLPGWT